MTDSAAFSSITLTAVDSSLGGGTGIDDVCYNNGPLPATPEPSSLVLLGTGIVGLAGAARRRMMAAR